MSKFFFTSFVYLLCLQSNSQAVSKSQPCSKVTDGSVKAFIENVKEGNISREQLSKGFELQLSDPSFTIKSFEVVYEHNQDLNVITNNQKTVNPAGKPLRTDPAEFEAENNFYARIHTGRKGGHLLYPAIPVVLYCRMRLEAVVCFLQTDNGFS